MRKGNLFDFAFVMFELTIGLILLVLFWGSVVGIIGVFSLGLCSALKMLGGI